MDLPCVKLGFKKELGVVVQLRMLSHLCRQLLCGELRAKLQTGRSIQACVDRLRQWGDRTTMFDYTSLPLQGLIRRPLIARKQAQGARSHGLKIQLVVIRAGIRSSLL